MSFVIHDTMKTLQRMPAGGCRFHLRGRCLYPERLNPGYTRAWRCEVLESWEKVFDDFLRRAEAFNLEQREVNELWATQFERLTRGGIDCRKYEHDPSREPPACMHLYEGLCIPALPECEGRCRHYAIRGQNDKPCHEEQE